MNIPLILSKNIKEHMSMVYALEYTSRRKITSRHSRIRYLKMEILRNSKLCQYFATYYPKQWSKRVPTHVLYTQKFAAYMLYNHPELYFTWMNLDLMYLTYTNNVEESLYAAIASKKMIRE